MKTSSKKIIPITELRRNFGAITAKLAEIDSLILTKGGEPFAILKASPEEKKKRLKKSAGAWKDTSLDNGDIWREAQKKKSRKTLIDL
ncbi:MAG: hypothetical protein A2748_03040 [Candidatus Wildermuthbacteria bacterium RIFCSPHIGHO2_01_FULL_45_20]|uniref:Antitoxin n=1 Tax=Candidatus Wildermuthbacteria bacterium RIFCSPHIGHO2_02_FULL_45_25 TaxID=1802450 RepID=A0A1G2R4V5_9BACT|nr:MAG: hypothetical protein A2748_03040 [Candidatus Wildermuthbacteria bacterium RIFCSPHIGHO2_01_FULL_45_20]OHA67894.1 MAG: hypothetical protein A3C04_04435 [Candidatus Wildermuthbacteria bacterium RIFCSPHIGHO2_02_FULL_45_25]